MSVKKQPFPAGTIFLLPRPQQSATLSNMDKPIQKNPSPLMFVLGVSALVVIWYTIRWYAGGGQERERVVATIITMSAIEQAINTHFIETGTLPPTLAKLNQPLEDAWKTPFRYTPEGTAYTLCSAGCDRQFDTNDDLCHSQTLTQSETTP